MTDDVRPRLLNIYPSIPHHLMSVKAIFRNSHRVHFPAASVILCAARVTVCVREDYVDATGINSSSGARSLAPVVVPANDILYCVRILVAIVRTRILVTIKWSITVFMKRWRKLVPVFS